MADQEPILPSETQAAEVMARGPISSEDPKPKPGPPKVLTIPPPHESVFRYANTHNNRKINKNAWWRIILRLLFSHVGLFFLVSLYAIAGSYIFIKLEKPNEMEEYEAKKVRYLEMNDSINYISDLLWFYQTKKLKHKAWNKLVFKEIKALEEFIITSVEDVNYDGTHDGWNHSWTFYNTLLFTMTIMSTIGYGHIFPKTAQGRIFCIIYAMFGIPLLLLFLAGIGDFMARAFRYTYSRWCCHMCRMRRKKSEYRRENEYLPVPRVILQSVSKEKVGEEEYMSTKDIDVPIVLTLLFLSSYITAGAFLFSYWEDWDLVAATYFTFITLATVGYGDLVPGNSFTFDDEGEDDEAGIEGEMKSKAEKSSDDVSSMFRMLGALMYCAFGLAILSMCVSLMQQQIVKKVKTMGEEIGLIKPKPAKDEKKEEEFMAI